MDMTIATASPTRHPARPRRGPGPHRRGGALISVLTIVLGLAALVGGALWGVNVLNSDADDAAGDASPVWHTVERRSFDITIIASGELEARDKVTIKSEVEGRTTIVEVVPEGTFVKQEDLLVKLADDQLKERIQQAELSLEKAQSDAVAASETYEIETSEADSLYKADSLKVDLAKLALNEWEKGTLVQKRNELDLKIVEAQDTLEIAARDFHESDKLLKLGFISLSEYQDAELKHKQAVAALKTAELAKTTYEKYTFEQEEKQFTSTLAEAEAALDRTIRKNKSKLAQAEAARDSAQRSLKLQQENMTKLKDQLAKCTILAPRDGLVVYATSVGSSRHRRGDPIQQGLEVSFNESLILLPDTSQMVATLKVNESRLPLVREGQKTTIIIDALKGRPVEGTVSRIAVMAEDSGYWSPDVREYEVRVALPEAPGGSSSTASVSNNDGATSGPRRGRAQRDNADGGDREIGLKPGMRCMGKIFVGHVPEAVAVPIHAVFTERKDHYVWLRTDSGRVRRLPVTIGRASETYVEIRSGLEVGQVILLRKPTGGEIEQDDKAADKGRSNRASSPPDARGE